MMNKQVARHFQAHECTISSLMNKFDQTGSVKDRHRIDIPRKTTKRDGIGNVTSSRRNRFLSNTRIHALLKMPRELGFVQGRGGGGGGGGGATLIIISKTTQWCAPTLTSPIR